MTEPFRAGMQRARIETAGMHPALHLALDQPGAFKHLDVPVKDQIHIISEIHKTGRLHATLIVE